MNKNKKLNIVLIFILFIIITVLVKQAIRSFNNKTELRVIYPNIVNESNRAYQKYISQLDNMDIAYYYTVKD